MQRVLRNTQADLRFLVTGKDGDAQDATGTPTVSIVRDSTGAVAASGNATDIVGIGLYGFTLSANNIPECELLRCTLTATVQGVVSQKFVTLVEVVGGHMCSLEAIQDSQGSSPTTDLAKLREAREWAEGWLEDECRVAFRPRYRKQRLDGRGGTDLLLGQPRPLSLLSVTVGDTVLDATALAAIVLEPEGVLYRAAGWTEGRQNVTVAYTHGYEQTPEAGVRAAVNLARFYLSKDPSNRDERATRIETDEASYSLVTPGMRNAIFSIPEVNVFVRDYGYAGAPG